MMVRNGEADVLVKGLVSTDVLLRAVLNKERGILPPGRVLTHVAVSEMKEMNRMLVFSDSAVIPYPTPEQRRSQIPTSSTSVAPSGQKNRVWHCSTARNM